MDMLTIPYDYKHNIKNLFDDTYEDYFHDLKSYNNNIYCAVQLMERVENNPEELYSYFEIIKKSTYKINTFIKTVSIYRAFPSQTVLPNFKNHNIISVIEETVLNSMPLARRKNINLYFDTNCEEKIATIDKEMIERIILNLISNAVKFTESNGEISVTLDVEEDKVHIMVLDDGNGIENENIGRVFERYVSFDNDKSRGRSQGLGLFIVKQLVELHGGTVFIESKTKNVKGTKVTICIPIFLDNNAERIFEEEGFYFENVVQMGFF